jgi:ABC-type lipoprotein export system ATPase subunit
MAVVRARAVTKGFGSGRAARRVLDGADLDVQRGELVAIVGRSGSGKSTLLHVVAGLDHVDGGTIEVDGERVDGASDRRLTALRARSIGFVFQFFHLVPELTGEENVLLPTRVNGARAASAARGQELIDALGLRDVARSLPHELSGG